ncbi:MAG: GNAT family N-acetyltransferase [Nanoarchaeota archaeon]|nr:GNAT family N-acetyltransferase [Nanoarchaeota archaeon]
MVETELTKITQEDLWGKVDKAKLEALVEDGFGKPLVEDYFQSMSPEAVYLAHSDDRYLGAIILTNPGMGEKIHYLDKIVVSKEKQSNGTGKMMWNYMTEDLKCNGKKLFWRAKQENPINNFYQSVCEGMQKVDGWNIYWIGLNPSELKEAIEYAITKPETLKKIE